jgi:hypothetical protein
MGKKSTLSSKRRVGVLQTYRSLSKSHKNCWLVYSIKTDRDWILTGDMELIYWASFLESHRDVSTFHICSAESDNGRKLVGDSMNGHAIVTLQNGTTELHQLASEKTSECDELSHADSTVDKLSVRHISENDLRLLAPRSVRWLKAIAFAAALRDQQHIPAAVAVANTLWSLRQGVVGNILAETVRFDSATVLGLIARSAIKGDILLDLSIAGYTPQSPWKLRDDE